jgi:energy-coupling factor transporter transmembrane protein EcfT
MGLARNILMIIVLLILVWAIFLLVSYVITVTVLYTLELPGDTTISIARVVLGLIIAGAWILGWYKLTKLWLYKILLARKRET